MKLTGRGISSLKYFLGILAVFFVIACSDNKKPEVEKIFEPQIDTYKKAQQVENMVLDRVDRQNEALERQLE